ncbi:MAG: hypothetical protein NC918_02580 [Candidatus Omnitrophica bacterium]|nr:hypothetical protein [Candidatus Omnitrophota bacterium]
MNFETLFSPSKVIFALLGRIFIKAIVVGIVLVIGWVISKIIKSLVIRILKLLKFDFLADKIDLDKLLVKGQITLTLSEIIGEIAYWFTILITFVIAANMIGLNVAADLLNRIVLYIPNIVASIFILVLGMLGATALGNITRTAAANAGLARSNFLGNLVKIVLIVFTVIMSLKQLNIETKILELAFVIVLATIGLAIAIAFGFGCKDIAAEALRKWLEKIK